MCAICAGITVRVEGSIFLQGKTLWSWYGGFVYKIITLRAIDKAYVLGNKSNGSWSLSNAAWDYWRLFDIKDLRSTAKVKQRGIHMGLILHTPWQMQMGTYETWGISLTDRAAGNKNVAGTVHWLTNDILK